MTEPVKMIVVDADGEIITAANGKISSNNPELVRLAKEATWYSEPVQLVAPFGRFIQPSLDPEDLIGIIATLYSVRPGRTILLEAPEEVWHWFEVEIGSHGACLGAAQSPNVLQNDYDRTDFNNDKDKD